MCTVHLFINKKRKKISRVYCQGQVSIVCQVSIVIAHKSLKMATLLLKHVRLNLLFVRNCVQSVILILMTTVVNIFCFSLFLTFDLQRIISYFFYISSGVSFSSDRLNFKICLNNYFQAPMESFSKERTRLQDN